MLHPVRLGVVGNEVVVLVVPPQMPWADAVPPAVPAQRFLLLHRPLKVLETDLLSLSDGSMELINVIVDALVHGLDPPGDQHLSLKLPGVVDADQRLQLFDEPAGLALRDEPGGLHRIHQQLQLRQLKLP